MRKKIELNLASVKTRIVCLIVYSSLLIFTSIIHIIINVYIIKLNKTPDFVNYNEVQENNSNDENNLIINQNLSE